MILVNIFRSSLDDKHDTLTPGHEITIRELFPDTDFTNSIISVNGFLQDEAYLLKDGDICAIRLFPEGEAKDWFAGLGLGGALGLIVGGLISMISGPIGWVGFGLAIGIGAAAGTLGAGIASAAGWSLWDFLVQKPGTADTKSADALQQIPQLRGAKNQSAYGHPVPIVLGKHLFTPLYIGRPYTTIGGTDGEDQYFHALYLLGYSRLKISDIKLGEIGYLAGNGSAVMDGTLPFDGRPEYAASNPRLELQQGASEVSLYPQAVVEEQLSVELSYPEGSSPLQALRHTAQNPMKVQVEFTLNNGLISYNDKGDKQDAAVSVSIQWRKTTEDDSDNWKPFGQAGAGQAGIYYSAPVTTITRQKAKIMRFVAERDFSYSDVKDASARTIELRIARTNIQANDNRTADRVYLTAIRTWLFDPDASAAANSSIAQVPMIAKLRDKTARLGFSIKATDALQGNIDSLNCIVQSYGRVWDGTQWTDPDWNIENQAWDTGASASREVPANNPASMALKLLQSPGLGRKAYPDGMLDMDSFAGFYEWCDERGYACNGVLAAEKRLDDVLAVILFTGRAMRILNGDKYGILVDKPREYPVMVLNSQNVLEASNQKAFEEVPDGLSIKFINEADGYQETEVYVMADGSKKPGPASVIESADMPYVTSYEQVVKNGWYQLACKRLRPEVWTRKVSVEGYLIGIGDRVEVQDDTIVVGIGEGAAIKGLKVEDGLITEIQTDGVFDVTDTAKQYGIKIMQFDGANPGTIRTIQVPVPEPGIYCNFTVAIPLDSDPPLPHEGDIIAFGVYGRITTPALCFGKKNNGDGTFELTLIPYQEGIYTTDSGIIPPYEANITTPQALAPPGDMPPDPVSKSEILESISGMDFTGAPAVVYELRPGVSVIKREDDGTFTPGAVSCAQVFITGDGLPETAHKTLSYITSEDDTPEYYTVPVTAGGWDWIEFILSDNDVELDRQRVPVLRNGIPATVYELRPSVNVISRAQDGITLEPSEISCAQEAVTGTGAPAPSGKTLKYIASGDSDETDYSGPVAVDSAWEWIEFRLYDGDSLLDRERVLILYQYVPATVYELLPGVSVIKHKYDDTIEPSSISCGQVKYTPGLSPSPGDKVIRYVTSNNPDTETDYTGEITINPAWAWIEFRLYEGASLLDLERVPVVYDGSDGIAAVVIDFANDNKIIPCGEDGVPYPGVLPFTNQGTLYNAGGGPAAWSLDNPPAGVTIDQAGLVTVADGAALGEAEEIRVSLVLGGKTYGKTFNITKIIDGSNPVFVDLENDNKTIACDEDGVPLLDALPFTNQAVLYRGNAAVTEGVSWRVENAAPGLSIDGEGLISAEAGTQFADNNDIGVTATLGGADYTAVFTVSKAYAGKSPVVIHLDNQNRELMCDIDGNVKPGQLPMAMKAELYRGTARVTGYVGMAYYPVSGGDDLIDPMPGVPYPVEPVIIWSLLGAPPGVSINKWEGVITIVGNAVLDVSNDITVQALWRGETYTALLHLGKVFDGQRGDKGGEGKQGSPAPHYRGKTVSPGGVTGLVTIQINANTTQTVQMSRGDWVAYLGGPIADTIWEPYKCMRWNGASWEQVSSENETSLYMAALMDLTEGAPDGTFTAVFCRVIAAQQAFINELQTKLIHVESAIYGGERYDQNGNVIDDSKDGYWLGSNGRLRAVGGEFDTVDILGNSIFHGDIISGPLVLLSDTPEGNKYTAPAGSSASGIPVPDNNMPILGRYGSIDIIKGRKYEYINTIKVHNSSYKDTDEYTDIYFVTTSGSDMLIARRIIQERWHHEGGFENYWWREVNYIYPITTAYYLEWQYVMSGKTLRLIDLPTKIPEQPGTVYRSGNNLMIK